MKIYLICPVRNITPEQQQEIFNYVVLLESKGQKVHYPPRDVDQEDPTGWTICKKHCEALIKSDEVHIFWDVSSKGSHFDLGMAFALDKKLKLVKAYQPDNEGKSYLKVINEIQLRSI